MVNMFDGNIDTSGVDDTIISKYKTYFSNTQITVTTGGKFTRCKRNRNKKTHKKRKRRTIKRVYGGGSPHESIVIAHEYKGFIYLCLLISALENMFQSLNFGIRLDNVNPIGEIIEKYKEKFIYNNGMKDTIKKEYNRLVPLITKTITNSEIREINDFYGVFSQIYGVENLQLFNLIKKCSSLYNDLSFSNDNSNINELSVQQLFENNLGEIRNKFNEIYGKYQNIQQLSNKFNYSSEITNTDFDDADFTIIYSEDLFDILIYNNTVFTPTSLKNNPTKLYYSNDTTNYNKFPIINTRRYNPRKDDYKNFSKKKTRKIHEK